MLDYELKALGVLLSSADNVQTGDDSHKILRDLADKEARKRGMSGWVDALHKLEELPVTHYCKENGEHAVCDPQLDEGWYLTDLPKSCTCLKCLSVLRCVK